MSALKHVQPVIEVGFADDLSSFPTSVLIVAIRMGGNLDQLDLMLDFMTGNRILVLNDRPTRAEKRITTKLWEHLSGNLNALGCAKSTAEWRKFWSMLVIRAKARFSASRRPARLNNNTGPPLKLGYYDEKILEILRLITPQRGYRYSLQLPVVAPIQPAYNADMEPNSIFMDMAAIVSEVNSNIKDSLIMVKNGFDRLLNMANDITAPQLKDGAVGSPRVASLGAAKDL